MYLQHYPIVQVPVDEYDLTQISFKDVDQMNNIIFDNSVEYEYLSEQQFKLSCQLGFQYLNSDQCNELFEQLHFLEKSVLKRINNEKLVHIYEKWINFLDKRENAMINNIYNYSRLNKFETAIFIIGAEHRKSIIDKISEYEMKNELKLNWIYNSF